MWIIYWDDKQLLLDTVEKVMNTVDQLNKEYVEKEPILIRVENDLGDMMCMGIGHREEYSIIDFFPSESSSSKSVEGENAGTGVVCFDMGGYESEFTISKTIQYKTAFHILRYFLEENALDANVNWIDD